MTQGATGLPPARLREQAGSRYDPSAPLPPGGTAFTLFTETDRPDLNGSFGLQGMVEDRHGTVWLGFSGGLFRFDGKGFVHVGRTASETDATRGAFALH